ncbi:MAG TPA: phosphatidate cytidylyltransferase, partial [Candidatus Acidoferrales bacterium]|nr:phosphatidate cytidylyltransferase [Candidatus Acidoferrales bacterium]
MPRLSPLTVRILSGAVILLAVMGLVIAGIYGVYTLVLVLGGLALWEFRDLSDHMGSRAPSWLLYPLGAYFAFSGTLLKEVSVGLVLSLALVVGLAAFLFLPGRRQGLGRWAMGMAGALYIGMPFNYYLLLYSTQNGLAWVLFTIFAVVASDSGALLVGMRLGRTPFFANISPKKTLEGAIGGVLAAVLVMVTGAFGVLGLHPLHAVVLGVLIGVSAEAGDLV